jgi:hypothetical protein
MKSKLIIQLLIFILINQVIFSQEYDKFLDAYYFNKLHRTEKQNSYNNVEGSPYLSDDFSIAEIYLKDTTAFRMPLRYNIYADVMEYKVNDAIYMIDKPHLINKIVINGSNYVFIPFIEKGGYFEILISGRCYLLQRRIVKYKPAEGPKPIEGVSIPAKFVNEKDKFYIIVNSREYYEIINLKTLVTALSDKKESIDQYLKTQKIKNIKKENLIKIAAYYNSL